jgi:hypothetical protein
MKKLKLEELEVTSFATTTSAARDRGTVLGAAAAPKTNACPVIETYNVQACGDTQYFDCTYGCSYNTNCANTCGVVRFTEGPDCVETA